MPFSKLIAVAPSLLALVHATSTLGCDHPRGGPDGGTARPSAAPVETSLAPPLESAPLPAPPPPGAPQPAQSPPEGDSTRPSLACPKGMLRVPGGLPPRVVSPAEPVAVRPFCVDRWEAQLTDKLTGMVLSPYYPPERKLASQIAAQWEKQRLEVGNDEARQLPLPPLPEWQKKRDFEPVAVSRPNAVPNGYVSGVNAEKACKNAGKRLCRHDEWVLACEG